MRNLLLSFMIISIIIYAVYKGNTTVGTSYYEITSNRIPPSFDTYKIVQLSDLHDAQFGENHAMVVNKVKDIAPQAIFITGDFIDSNRYNLEQSLLLVKEIQNVAPIYYVTGNHEIATNDVERIKESLKELGVRVLSDEADIVLRIGDEAIAIGGIEDPLASISDEEETIRASIGHAFAEIPDDMFKILLSHRPEHLNLYAENNIDLTFSGHAHGGQFRIPGVGGLISPGEGFFPEFTSGIHGKNESHLVISRGLGNSLVPIRIFNKPEIVVVTLKKVD